jgi:5'-nucleotidase
MNILLTNDDGINAVGLNWLADFLTKNGDDVFICAPDRERSCCGHALSLGIEVYINKINDRKYSCSGFPADCVQLGVKEIFKDIHIDIVISGINHGANLGQDIYYSGTVAGAREASFLNIPSLALSLCSFNPTLSSFQNVFQFFESDFYLNIISQFELGKVVNVNFPVLDDARELSIFACDLSFREYSNSIKLVSRKENSYIIDGKYTGSKISIQNTDSDVIERGQIALSYLKVF